MWQAVGVVPAYKKNSFLNKHCQDDKTGHGTRILVFLLNLDSRCNSCNSHSGSKVFFWLRLSLKSILPSSRVTANSSRWEDELVGIEFLVTVRHWEHGLIVMTLSVTVWSQTDRWSVCWAFWGQAESGSTSVVNTAWTISRFLSLAPQCAPLQSFLR